MDIQDVVSFHVFTQGTVIICVAEAGTEKENMEHLQAQTWK